MCQQSRYIYNPYSRRKVLVPCGHCIECQQEKALKRTERIRNNVPSGCLAYFVTLTYTNDSIPYIRKSDLLDLDNHLYDVPVYRDSVSRFIYSPVKGSRFKKDIGTSIIKEVFVPVESRYVSVVDSLKHIMNGSSDKVGVLLNSDIQKFFKRLSINLKRLYNYDKPLNYFYCGELGSFSQRPHFHALVFFPSSMQAEFRNAIFKSWPYSSQSLKERGLEIAKDVASYVSSYCNKSFGFSSPLEVSSFSPKHNYSRGFGIFLDCFSLHEILLRADRGNLRYYTSTKITGTSQYVSLAYPSYVISRYFPKFKGYSQLPVARLESLLSLPESASDILKPEIIGNYLYSYSPKETYRIYVKLENAYQRFHSETGLNRFDYAYYYQKVWNLRKSHLLEDSYSIIECDDDWYGFYENIASCSPDLLDSLPVSELSQFVLNPNLRPDVIKKNNLLSVMYQAYDKRKKVTNYAMSQMGLHV